MIAVKCISKVKYDEHDEVWAIVRIMKHQNPNIKQMADLSPSWDLFGKYKEKSNDNEWNQNAFQSMYVSQFLEEMHGRKAKQLLNELYLADKNGKNICLVCFCPDETMCHRSIVAGLLQGVGCNVTGVQQDYSYYYEMYKDIGRKAKTEEEMELE